MVLQINTAQHPVKHNTTSQTTTWMIITTISRLTVLHKHRTTHSHWWNHHLKGLRGYFHPTLKDLRGHSHPTLKNRGHSHPLTSPSTHPTPLLSLSFKTVTGNIKVVSLEKISVKLHAIWYILHTFCISFSPPACSWHRHMTPQQKPCKKLRSVKIFGYGTLNDLIAQWFIEQ